MSNKVFCNISISADGYLTDGLDAALNQPRTAAGAGDVRLDQRRLGAVGRGLTDQTAGYDAAPDRYLATVSGSADGHTLKLAPAMQAGGC